MRRNKILAFGASNSIHSINKKLVTYASTLFKNSEVTLIDLNDFIMPLYGIDLEKEEGIPQKAYDFKDLIEEHDGMMLSMAEHNGAYTAAFKNIFDWISRIEGSTWGDKPMLLLGTSPGGRGASSVLDIAAKRFPFNGGFVKGIFSLPFFNKNFDQEVGITDADKNQELKEKVVAFEKEVLVAML